MKSQTYYTLHAIYGGGIAAIGIQKNRCLSPILDKSFQNNPRRSSVKG